MDNECQGSDTLSFLLCKYKVKTGIGYVQFKNDKVKEAIFPYDLKNMVDRMEEINSQELLEKYEYDKLTPHLIYAKMSLTLEFLTVSEFTMLSK